MAASLERQFRLLLEEAGGLVAALRETEARRQEARTGFLED
ncbi:hypothetical protein ABZ490_46245 [Streptomyces sp. NPDC005811]